MLIKNLMHKENQILIKKKVKSEISKIEYITDDFMRFFFVLSFKKTNIFFSFFSLYRNKYNLLKKKSCGLINRRSNLHKQIKKRKIYKTKLDYIFEVYNKFFSTINYNQFYDKNYKSFLFLKFKIFFLDYKTFILIKKTIRFFKEKKKKFIYYINYKQAHNGCRKKQFYRKKKR